MARRSDTVRKQRKVQREIDSKKSSSKKSDKAIQTGPRKHPGNPLPKQHQVKPGIEAKLKPRPQFRNPDYLGSAKLADKVALITGGDSGIGRAVAVLFAREGADVSIVYLSEDLDAKETKRVIEEEEGRRCILIPGDVKDPRFCQAAVERTVDELGGPRCPRQQCRVPGTHRGTRRHHGRTFRSDVQDEHLRLLLHGQGRASASEEWKLDH